MQQEELSAPNNEAAAAMASDVHERPDVEHRMSSSIRV